jgi:hypothetical protein
MPSYHLCISNTSDLLGDHPPCPTYVQSSPAQPHRCVSSCYTLLIELAALLHVFSQVAVPHGLLHTIGPEVLIPTFAYLLQIFM